jgi:molybdopterin adenylyltransferase
MSKIHSINISAGKGVPKTPVPSAELEKGRGIKGDAHAGTDIRQVSLLDVESVRAQAAEARDKGAAVEIRPGIYAENITTEGLDLAVLRVGDTLRLGGSAVLRISKIGKECHSRCAIFHQVGDCIMPRRGVFAEVLESGGIKAGDSIEKISSAPLFTFAVLTSSDRCARGEAEDVSGAVAADLAAAAGGRLLERAVVPDEQEAIRAKLEYFCGALGAGLVLTTGGTGFSRRDVTPEATAAVIERQIPGFPELMRAEGLKHTKKACLSRGIAGIRGGSIIINLPGSPRAVRESLAAVLDLVPHALEMLEGGGH